MMPSPLLLAELELNPHRAFYFLLPVLPVAGAAIFYLYYQQKRLASKKVILALTVIRLLLLVLLAILFLRPGTRFTYTNSSAGTLWLLVDQSQSMQSADPQSTPVERLHWAQALGYVPKSSRTHDLDLRLGDLVALYSEFVALRPADTTVPADAELSRVSEFCRQLGTWSKAFDSFKSNMDSDAALTGSVGSSARDALGRISAWAYTDLQAAKASKTLHDAVDALRWADIAQMFQQAANDIADASAAADEAYLKQHGRDSDIAAGLERAGKLTRRDLAYEFLTSAKPARSGDRTLEELLPKYRVRIATFADAAQPTGTIDPDAFPEVLKSALHPGEASSQSGLGASTSISSGLQLIAEQLAPDEPASIIIVSDGRHNMPGNPAQTALLLAARGSTGSASNIRVFGLLTGSHQVSPDAAVDQIDAPEWVYKGDTLKATALVRLDGLMGMGGKTAHVELHRRGAGDSDILVNAQDVAITANQSIKPVEFSDLPPESKAGSGVVEYEVRVSPLAGETNLENNRSTFRVAVKKDKLFALVIDDRPRWEYRYLAAHLGRDPRIKLQTILLDPATVENVAPPPPVKASTSNPKVEAQILPQTLDEWQAFDLIVLGDIPVSALSNAQQQFIAAAVREKGSTLITIAGTNHMPFDFINTPLAELLPITMDPQFDNAAIVRHSRLGFRPGLAPEGHGSVLGQLGISADSNAALWSNIPSWFWHSPFTQVKPAASALWSVTDLSLDGLSADAPIGSAAQARKNALLSTLSVGLGKSLYLASDQTWRLRQVNGANIHERFWNNVLGWAVGADLPAGGKYVRFGASQPRYAEGQPIDITARVLQENLVPYTGLRFKAVATPLARGAATHSTMSVEADFQETQTAGYYRATLAGLPPGEYEIALQGPEVQRLLDNDPSVTQKTLVLKVVPQLNVERRNMNTDPELLARIAAAGNGFSLDACYADVLASHLPEIKRTQTTTQRIGFFTDPSSPGTRYAHWTFLALFTLLITLEWIIRKLAGLV